MGLVRFYRCMELSCLALISENCENKYYWKEYQDIPNILFPIFYVIPQNLCIENKIYNTAGSQDIAKSLFETHIHEFMDSFCSYTVLVWDEYGFNFEDTEHTKVEEIDIDQIIADGGLNEFSTYCCDDRELANSIIEDEDIADDIATISKRNPNTKFYLIYPKLGRKEDILKVWRIRNCNTIFLHNGVSLEDNYCGLSDEGFYGKVSKRNIYLARYYYRPYFRFPYEPRNLFYIESCLQLDFNSQNLELEGDWCCAHKRCEDYRNGKKVLFTWLLRPLISGFLVKTIKNIHNLRQTIKLRDNKISFNETNHTYTVDGKSLQSVTNIVENCFPKFDAELHAKNTAAKMCITPEEVIAMWEQKGKESRELGTAMHQKIEKYYQGEKPYEDDAFKLFKVFAEKVKLEPYRTEWAVYDTDYNIAGTIDFVDYQDGKYTIYDWKRSDKIIANGMPVKVSKYQEKGLYPFEHLENCAYYHYALQLSLYKFILEKNYDIRVSDLRLGIFHPSYDKPYVLKMPYLENEVKTLMELRSEVIL